MRMKPSATICVLWMVITTGVVEVPLWAQAPEVGHTFPAGGKAGTAVTVQLGGYDFTPDIDYFLHHPQATLKVTGKLGPYLVAPPPYWFGPKGRSTAFKIPRELTARKYRK